MSIVNNTKISHLEKSYKVSQLIDPIPNIFNLNISDSHITIENTSTESTSNRSNNNSIKANSYSTDLSSIKTEHQTSQLSRLVNVFTTYSKEFLQSHNHKLTLCGEKPRDFHQYFKSIKYFIEHTRPFVFYGVVSNVILNNSGYYIYFAHKQLYEVNNEQKLLPIGIFISNKLLSHHHRKKAYHEFFTAIPKK